MRVSALASGSSGNCFYIENEKKNQAVLVDCGISCKQIEERLSHIKKSPKKIKGIFLTHEHSDHIRGTDVFARKFNVPVFAPQKMVNESFLCAEKDLLREIGNNETIKLAGMNISSFPKSHKALDPVSYSIVNKDNKKLSIITDAGYACKNITDNIGDSDFICLESNYDEKMLHDGPYPWHLKKWISSDIGHLSNTQASCCILEHSHKKLKNVMLCHLSQNNNTPEKALETYEQIMKHRLGTKPKVSVSTRFEATPVFKV